MTIQRLSDHGLGQRMKVGDLITSITPFTDESLRRYLLIIQQGPMTWPSCEGFKLLCGEEILEFDVNYTEHYHRIVKP